MLPAINMRHLQLILLLISTQSFSQNRLDFGRVKADKDFSCEKSDFLDHFDSLQAICKSKNQLEIRFRVSYNPSLEYAFFVITYDGTSWTAIKYEAMYLGKIRSYRLKPLKDFDTIFLELKRSNIFLLPKQGKILRKIEVLDGVSYDLTFKAGDKFRNYDFDNPDFYSDRHKRTQQFQDYNRIAKILTTWFEKE
jgi:hypothetical protein